MAHGRGCPGPGPQPRGHLGAAPARAGHAAATRDGLVSAVLPVRRRRGGDHQGRRLGVAADVQPGRRGHRPVDPGPVPAGRADRGAELGPGQPGAADAGSAARPAPGPGTGARHLVRRRPLPGRRADAAVSGLGGGAVALRGDRGRQPLDTAGRPRPAERPAARLVALTVTTKAERVQRPRPARSAAFWLKAAVLVLFLAAAAAPTPLYRVYQARWGFSATTLTAVFAVYVVFLLVTVLIFGSLSDHAGRRPVIITALAVDTAACIVFLLAPGVGALFAARALQGVAVGLAANALGAALLDLRPAGSLAPLVTSNAGTVGLALGALGTSVLVQYGPAPTHLVWWLLLGTFLAAILLAAATPEPGTARPGALASLRPDVSVPRPARGTFARAAPCLVAVWALGGFYLSLGPSLAAQLSGSHNLVWGGLITFLLTGLGAVTASVFRNSAPIAVMLGGCLGLLGGAVVTIAAIVTRTPALLLLLGTVLAGLGFGPGNLGGYRVIMARASPSNRAGLIAAISIVNYLALGLPALIAGIATSHFGLHDTALVYSAVIALLAAAAAGGFLFESRGRTRAPQAAAPPPEPPPGPCTVPPYMQATRQEPEPAIMAEATGTMTGRTR